MAVHCLGGNAARSTELLSAMATDTSAGPRSVFSGVDSQTYITLLHSKTRRIIKLLHSKTRRIIKLLHSKTRRTDRPGKLVARFMPCRWC